MAQRILIIDEDPEFIEATSTLLDAQGYTVVTALNGRLGLVKAREESPAIILLDVKMTSDTEGFEVAREINKDPKLKNVPVIIISGLKKKMDRPFGFEPNDAWLPVKGILEKPVKPNVLLKTIAQYLTPEHE